MLSLSTSSTDPADNLALEEYLMEACPDGECIFFLWQSKSAVVVGRYQNMAGQIHPEFIEKNGITVIRRITGGGAVYQDLGNVNYSFIRKGPDLKRDFQAMVRPILSALAGLGIRAEFSSRNDITVNGFKVSGSAMHVSGNTILQHGTLLFHSDFSVMQQALNVGKEKLAAKGVSSVAGRVANLADFLPEPISFPEFCDRMTQSVLSEEPDSRPLVLTEADRKRVEALAAKYRTWEWNFGASPDYDRLFTGRLNCGTVELYIRTGKADTIGKIRILGDFFCSEDLGEVEKKLTGAHFDALSVQDALRGTDLTRYLTGVSAEALTALMFPENAEDRQ
jgi:lipoate---protein ligase